MYGEVKYFDFAERRPLSREEWQVKGFDRPRPRQNGKVLPFSPPRQLAEVATADSAAVRAVPPMRGAARYNREQGTLTREELIQNAANSIVAKLVYEADLTVGGLCGSDDEVLEGLEQEKDEALSALSEHDQEQAWQLVEEWVPTT